MVEDMLKKTKCLCSLIDSSMVEDVFDFLEMNRITVKPEKVKKILIKDITRNFIKLSYSLSPFPSKHLKPYFDNV